MAIWKRQTQEKKGDYWFNGRSFVTRKVFDEVPPDEIAEIIADLLAFVAEERGIDYLQVYVNEVTKQKIWVIDQLSREQVESGEFAEDDNHWTILFPEEY